MSPTELTKRVVSRAGFTLVEVLVALTVVSIIGLSTLAAVSASARSAVRAADSQVAAVLADELLAEISLLPDAGDERAGADHPLGAPFEHFRWQVFVRRPAGGRRPTVLVVRVFSASDPAVGASAVGLLPSRRLTPQ